MNIEKSVLQRHVPLAADMTTCRTRLGDRSFAVAGPQICASTMLALGDS